MLISESLQRKFFYDFHPLHLIHHNIEERKSLTVLYLLIQ